MSLFDLAPFIICFTVGYFWRDHWRRKRMKATRIIIRTEDGRVMTLEARLKELTDLAEYIDGRLIELERRAEREDG